MTDFYELIDEYLGDDDALTDIRATVRRLWFYDFDGYPLRIWQGKGRLFDQSGQVWLGSMNAQGVDLHETPELQDGRDGSSGTYETSLLIPDLPGRPALETYNSFKADQGLLYNRDLTCYMAIIQQGEGMRPQTPIAFEKQLTMKSAQFSESVSRMPSGTLIRNYRVTITSKDANFGRANRPNATYADTLQKQRALELGVSVDRGCEYLASIANRTYEVP